MVREGHSEILDIAIENGVISEVAKPGTVGTSREVIDATGLHVLPGAVDVHFHCRAPSHPERGTFGSETRAAAAGGVTTILEMPIADPPCSTPEVLKSRRELGERESHVDFGLFSGAALGSAATAESMVEAGAVGFKLFTHLPPPDRFEEFHGLWAATEEDIRAALETVAATELRCTVHAENQQLIEQYESETDSEGLISRPPVIESAAISILSTLAKETGARVHIAHMTSAAAVEALTAAKDTAAVLTGETCPHYLIFNEQQIHEYGSFVKVAPPLRTAEDNKALWEAVASGVIDVVASDHAPFTPEEKQVPYDAAPRGIPGVEMMVPVLLDAATQGRLPLERAVSALSETPAQLFSLFPKKGAIRPGSDADLILWDSRENSVVSLESLVSRSGGSAVVYNGMDLNGRIRRTLVRGATVFRDGQVTGAPRGRFVRPTERS